MTSATSAATTNRSDRFPRLALKVLFGMTLLLIAGCASNDTPPVTVADIVEMSQAGASSDEIIQRIEDSGTTYRLKASQLAELEKKGVSPAVIDYMQQTFLDSVQRNQAMLDWDYWVQDGDGYWYHRCGYDIAEPWCY